MSGISARSAHTVTLPDGTEQALRECQADTPYICNTCGGEATLHVFRPATIGCRCVHCLAKYGKEPTVTATLTMADGTEAPGPIRLALPGESHVGPQAIIAT